jgi:outer membrane immunogenic protein
MTNRLLLAAAATAALASAAPALAADDRPPLTGFYVGVNLGGTWGSSDVHSTASSPNGTIGPADLAQFSSANFNSNAAGFTGGLEAGYNHQMGHLLLGLETDVGFMDINQHKSNTFQSMVLINPPATFTIGQKVSADWIWTLRPRIGYVTGPWLIYGTVGLATTSAEVTTSYADSFGNTGSFRGNDSLTGWTAGGGVGYAINPKWQVKAEWLYADFGSLRALASAPGGIFTATTTATVKTNLIRVGVDYKF